jgi:WD40 repeat protein
MQILAVHLSCLGQTSQITQAILIVSKLIILSTYYEVMTFMGHSKPITCCCFDPTTQFLLSGSGDSTLKLWSLKTGEDIMTFVGHKDKVNGCEFLPHDSTLILSCSNDSTIRMWNTKTGHTAQTFQGHSAPVTSISICTFDSTLFASGSEDKTINIWNIKQSTPVKVLADLFGITSVCFSPTDSKRMYFVRGLLIF